MTLNDPDQLYSRVFQLRIFRYALSVAPPIFAIATLQPLSSEPQSRERVMTSQDDARRHQSTNDVMVTCLCELGEGGAHRSCGLLLLRAAPSSSITATSTRHQQTSRRITKLRLKHARISL